ncbi:MAG TPA: hypothetical protein G4O10_09165 [Dehalococcoidia bacterium]|nr:hypothetical protein [Dehalococcoidia bacterium]
MKVRILSMLIVLAVLASSITACIGTDSFLVKVMKLAPQDTYMITCVNLQTAVEDPEFNYVYDYMIDELTYTMGDIDVSDVTDAAIIETDFDYIYILMGNFDLRDIRDYLTELEFVDGEYKEVEIWTDDYDYAVAFIGNTIVAGDTDTVEACIRRHKNEQSSAYDNVDMKSVADKMPAAVVHVVFGPDVTYNFEVLSGGLCLRNSTSGDDVLDASGWLKFDSAMSAEDAMIEDIEDNLGWEFGITDVEARQSGQFIEFTGDM